jgi:hypothetical protein
VSSAFEDWFPDLRATGYEVTSEADEAYNSIAWAAGETGQWWWPDRSGSDYWPVDASRAVTLIAFVHAFQSLGYEVCQGEQLETGFQKVAIYANHLGFPTHAARQLPNGLWTSKLGRAEDITHSLEGLVGETYGTTVQIMRRPMREEP